MKYKIIGILLLLSGNIAFAINRNDLKVEIRFKVDDSTNTNSTARWSDTLLNSRINTVQKDIAKYTNCLYKRYTSSTTSGVQEYAMPTDCRTIDRVSFLTTSSTSAYKKLNWVSMVGKDRDSPYWENLNAGNPLEYYERGNVIGLVPKPADQYCFVSSPSLKIDYYADATDMTSDTDVPFGGDNSLTSYHYLIVLGVALMCKEDDRLYNEADMYRKNYIDGIAAMKQFIFTKPDRAGYIDVRSPH